METGYTPQRFDLVGLRGISERTLAIHFGLYEDHVRQTNILNGKIAELVSGGNFVADHFTRFSELKRRLGHEYNGMVLHEHYFGNLQKGGGGQPPEGSAFRRAAEANFGSFEAWREAFTNIGPARDVGWAVACFDRASGRLSNHWIANNEAGRHPGLQPVLVMDLWEHAYLLDYKPSERGLYIESFFSNIAWAAVEERMGFA